MPEDIRAQIEKLLADARALVPSELPPDLPPDLPPGKYTQGEPEWYRFEHRLWAIGEEIRQLMFRKTALRKDADLQVAFVDISTNRNAKRGRQSFVVLLGYKCCRTHAPALASQLDDPSVDGHVIGTLLKMQAPGFTGEIGLFVEHDKAWIRNKAKTYCERFACAE